MPKTWHASSSAPSHPIDNSATCFQAASCAPPRAQVTRLTEADLELLVEGIDFDDDFGREFEKEPVALPVQQPPARAPLALSQEEIDALVVGIDFTQDVEIDVGQGDRREQPVAHAPVTPERAESRSSGTPASSWRGSPSPALASLSRTSSLLELLSQQAQSPPPGLRRYSTVPAIDLCSSSPGETDQRSNEGLVFVPPHRCAGSGATEQAESDEEIVIVSRTRRKEVPTITTRITIPETNSATRVEPAAVPGFFARPSSLRASLPPPPPPPPPRALSPLLENVPRPTNARALARFKRDAKAADNAERQAQFRQRWPRTFSYKTCNKDARLVYTSSEAVVEEELREMTG